MFVRWNKREIESNMSNISGRKLNIWNWYM